jgi:hypothetical protein
VPSPVDVLVFRRNREQFPDEGLAPFWGLQVAWSADGTCVLAAAATHELLYEKLKAVGVDPTAVVVEFIPDPNVSYLG